MFANLGARMNHENGFLPYIQQTQPVFRLCYASEVGKIQENYSGNKIEAKFFYRFFFWFWFDVLVNGKGARQRSGIKW